MAVMGFYCASQHGPSSHKHRLTHIQNAETAEKSALKGGSIWKWLMPVQIKRFSVKFETFCVTIWVIREMHFSNISQHSLYLIA